MGHCRESFKKVAEIDKADSRTANELLAGMEILENFAGGETYRKFLPTYKKLTLE